MPNDAREVLTMMRLYEFPTSGNCYKIRLALAQTGTQYERKEMGRNDGSTKTPEFRKLSPLGKVPALEVAPGKVLVESVAILFFLAKGTPLFPHDALEQAEVLRWMCFEQSEILPKIGTARFIRKMLGAPKERAAELSAAQDAGYASLAILDGHLGGRKFVAGETYTIADIALYAYVHLAPDAGMDLSKFPHVATWLGRVKQQPGHVELMQ
jgi:glutathione S-transferase